MPPSCSLNHTLPCLLSAARSSKPFLCPALNSCSICIHTAQWLCPDPSGLTPDLSPHAQHMCRGLIRAFFFVAHPCALPLRYSLSQFPSHSYRTFLLLLAHVGPSFDSGRFPLLLLYSLICVVPYQGLGVSSRRCGTDDVSTIPDSSFQGSVPLILAQVGSPLIMLTGWAQNPSYTYNLVDVM